MKSVSIGIQLDEMFVGMLLSFGPSRRLSSLSWSCQVTLNFALSVVFSDDDLALIAPRSPPAPLSPRAESSFQRIRLVSMPLSGRQEPLGGLVAQRASFLPGEGGGRKHSRLAARPRLHSVVDRA